jgi:hypothetical protein
MDGRVGYKRIDGEHLYMRGDMTLTYYFSKEELVELFSDLECISCDYCRKTVINHKEGKDMDRVFVQGRFRKM